MRDGSIKNDDASDLFRQTLRTMAILVASCVLFVGALSVLAVVVTSKALGPSPSSAELETNGTSSPKKPLSI